MFVPYMTIGEMEITHSLAQNDDDNVQVLFEQPDDIYFFKTALVDINRMFILKREGFSDEEMSELIRFCRNNKDSILHYSKHGGAFYA